MVGRILFAGYTGTSLDYSCKRWRMFADVTNDTVMLVELVAPALPKSLVMPVLCLAGVGRSLVGVAGGATKAAVAQHQARRNNMADLAAKDGSQETLVNLLALCLNLAILPLVTGNTVSTATIFLCLTVLHIYANYRAVSCLVIPTLNKARLSLVLTHLNSTGQVLGPREANRLERVIWPCTAGDADTVSLGLSIAQLQPHQVLLLEDALNSEQLYLVLPPEGSQPTHHKVLLSSKAGPRDVYGAYLEAVCGLRHQPDILDRLEEAGWQLTTLAVETLPHRYLIPS